MKFIILFAFLIPMGLSSQIPELVLQRDGHTDTVLDIDLSMDGRSMLSVGEDDKIILWDLDSKKFVKAITSKNIRNIKFSREKNKAIAFYKNGRLGELDLISGQTIRSAETGLEKVYSIETHDNVQTLIFRDSTGVAQTWDVLELNLINTTNIGAPPLTRLDLLDFKPALSSDDARHIVNFAYSPDKNFILFALGTKTTLWSTSPGLPPNRKGYGEIILWDVNKNSSIRRYAGHNEMVTCVRWQADQNSFISGSFDKNIIHWSLDGSIIKEYVKPEVIEIKVEISKDFSKAGFAGLSGGFHIWDLKERAYLDTLSIPNWVRAFDFSSDGLSLVTGGWNIGDLNIWDANTGFHQKKLEDKHCGHGITNQVKFIDNDTKLLVGSSHVTTHSIMAFCGVTVYSFITNSKGDTIGANTNYGKIDNYYDGYQMVLQPDNMSLWDVQDGHSEVLYDHSRPVYEVKNSNSFVASKQSSAWSWNEGDLWKFWDKTSGEEWIIKKKGQQITHFDQSSDQNDILVIHESGLLECYDVKTRRKKYKKKIAKEATGAVFFHNKEKILVSYKNGSLRVKDLPSGKERTILQKGANQYKIQSISEDGRYAVLFGDFTVKIVDLKSKTIQLEYGKKTEYASKGDFMNYGPKDVQWFKFLPGNKGMTATYDGIIKIWNLRSGEEIASLLTLNDRNWVVTTPSGLFDASAEAMRSMYYVVGTEIIELDQLKDRYYEPKLLQKILGFNNEAIRDVSRLGEVALYPEIRASIDKTILNIDLIPREGGIGAVSIFINNKEVVENANPHFNSSLSLDLNTFAKYFSASHTDTIRIRTFNKEGWLKSRLFNIPFQASKAKGDGVSIQLNTGKNAKPHFYSVIIGTANYINDEMDLRYSDKDSKSMAIALENAGKKLFEERAEVYWLSTDGDPKAKVASKSNIEEVFQEIKNKAYEQDIVLVYLSGHGTTYKPEEDQFYYLTKDVTSDNLYDPEIRSYAISTSELTEWMNLIPAKKQIMILDACYSGKLVEDIIQKKDLPSSQIRALDRMKDRTGTFLISGSASDKVSYEATQYGQGLLTYSLLMGMRGGALNPDKRLDIMKLLQYARDNVPLLAENIGGIQSPVIAAPSNAESFDIGIVTDPNEIPIVEAKPVFIQSNFQEENLYDDVINLSELLDDRLMNLDIATDTRQIVFIPVKKYPDGYSVKGRYHLKEDGRILLNSYVFKNNDRQGTKIEISGHQNNLQSILETLLERIGELINVNNR